MNIPNYHVLKITYIGPTNNRPSRVKILSERFEQSKTISYNHELRGTLEIAEKWLVENGFNLVGHAEGNNCYYVVSDTFKSPLS